MLDQFITSSVTRLNNAKKCNEGPEGITAKQHGHETESVQRALWKEGEVFLDKISTCDETWAHYFEPESIRQSMEFKHTSPPRLKIENPSVCYVDQFVSLIVELPSMYHNF